ncbi:MAG: 1-phosphatidylinositol-3-phosphate 5-kinase [Bogoriella megaspora]|nr:MAG: 1-phosphatidylinositol-3-phosphate 5-kinase [Bogoriella megaspora]
MATKLPTDKPSPSTSSVRLPLASSASRRGSLASLYSPTSLDKSQLAQALDQIHTTASQSEALTTFHEFASPPSSSSGTEGKSLADDIQGGLSGLYTRFRASVNAAKDAVSPASPSRPNSRDQVKGGSQISRNLKPPKRLNPDVSSPVVVSTPNSQSRSPIDASFGEIKVPSPNPAESLQRALLNNGATFDYASSISSRGTDASSLNEEQRVYPSGDQRPKVQPLLQDRLATSTLSSARPGKPHVADQAQPREPLNAESRLREQSVESPAPFAPSQPTTRSDTKLRDRGPKVNITSTDGLDEDAINGSEVLLPAEKIGSSNRHIPEPEGSEQPKVSPIAAGPNVISPPSAFPVLEETLGRVSAQERPPMIHVSQSHLPGFQPSVASSMDGTEHGSVSTSGRLITPQTPSLEEHIRKYQNHRPQQPHSPARKKLLDKQFWMKDENAKDCFYCGEAFSTFRRKHHCRICGQIFDAKCTRQLPGRLFGQNTSVRVCKPCESVAFNNEDDSSVFSESDEEPKPSVTFKPVPNARAKQQADDMDVSPRSNNSSQTQRDHTDMATPMMGIPVSRRAGDKRHSAILEFERQPVLARPSSSRSLKSMSGRPRSSSHKRHYPRHQHHKSWRLADERVPFQRNPGEDPSQRAELPAFHNDSIIDPDLAPFMSDDGSSGDEQSSIFTTMEKGGAQTGNGENDRNGVSSLLAGLRKGRSRTIDRNTITSNLANRDTDTLSLGSRPISRPQRRRNLSVGSFSHTNRPSPKRSKSNSLLRSFGLGAGDIPGGSPSMLQNLAASGPGLSKLKRSSSMRGAKAPALELNAASMQHVRRLLKQMLRDAEISRVHNWENALIPILLQSTDDVDPNVQHGDDIDIRHYLKLKKVPGGRPDDTAYVSGVVFTKNVALRSMPRSIPTPRIMIVSFAIEYARHQQLMSLEPVIAQEREYLSNIVGRIKQMKPKVLLVQKNVSGLALELLNEANIAVVFNIKESVLNAVSRCTQTRIITSIDKISLEPTHLGKCDCFDVKTYVHDGVKQSYVYLSGCEPRLGCTIVLRGANREQLRRLKAITEFMCYVVYNLKLETSLMRDEFISIPSVVATDTLSPTSSSERKDRTPLPYDEKNEDGLGMKLDQHREREFINSRLQSRLLGESQPVMARTPTFATAEGTVAQDLGEEPIPDDVPPPSYYSDLVEKHKTRVLSSSPFVQFMLPYLLMRSREQERRLAHLKRLRDQYDSSRYDDEKCTSSQKFELVKCEMMHVPLQSASQSVREYLYALHNAEYEKAMHFYLTQKRQWESYITGNVNLFDPFAHQNIAVLYSLVSTVTSVPCAGPEIIALSFYGDHEFDHDGQPFDADCTLGQYVEDLVYSASDVCKANGCGKRMFDHHRQYVHADGQLSVFVEKYPSRFKGLEQTILMWSVCRICGQETQVIPMSENTWRYSFGKYLELSFWSSALHARAGVCPHDIHRNHVRYFGLQNTALRLQYDTVVLYEVIVPRPTITWKVEADLRLKNDQYIRFLERLNHFMTSVKARLEGINVEAVDPEKADACTAELDRLLKQANDDHEWLTRKLQDKYLNAKYYEVIPMNRAVRAMWEKALEWDDAFTDFEQKFFPSEKDIRRLAALQLKRLFIERSSSATSLEEGDTDVETLNEKDSLISEKGVPPGQISVAKARDMMTSVVEEDAAKSSQNHTDAMLERTPSGENNDADTTDIERKQSVASRQSETVERDEVRHLDLAVPLSASESLPSSTPSPDKFPDSRPAIPSPALERKTLPEEPVMQPSPLDKDVAKKLEYLDNQKQDSNHLQVIPESKIPRPTEHVSRQNGSMPAPPLLRAQTQPVRPLRRENSSTSGIGALASPGPVTAALTTLQAESPLPPQSAGSSPEHNFTDRLGTNTIKAGKILTQSLIPRSIHGRKLESKVSTLAKHFDQLSREFEKERLRERKQRTARNRQSRLYPIASSKPVVEVYKDANEALQDRDPTDDDPNAPFQQPSMENSATDESKYSSEFSPPTSQTLPSESEKQARASDSNEQTDNDDNDPTSKGGATDTEVEGEGSDTDHFEGSFDDLETSRTLAEHPSLVEDPRLDIDLELPKHEKNSLMKMLTSFWADRSASGWLPLEYPLYQPEHVWTDSDIIVREDEPSCIIALALSSPDYKSKLVKFRKAHREAEEKRLSAASGEKSAEDTAAAEAEADAILERSLLGDTGTNMKYSFQHGSVKAQCKIFYAESFDALRRKCGIADRFIESMSRCLKWDSKGGKTKSLFLKTLDDRFVLKSLSKVEVDHFTKFAPDYFSFMAETMFHGMPSVIAKMFGLFHVVIKSPATGVEFNWFLLVMENLFYDRQLTRRFDLKGSMRNRKIESTGEKDEVLLDENLVETIFESPLFVREHSKKLLKASVYNDTLFLSKQNVMDYSLMAGIDDQRREMVIGIIDCIRTYTWDKKLESWIKDRGKNKPTITSPKDYRNRFRVSISNYFLQAPNCWHQFQAQQLQKKTLKLEVKRDAHEEIEVETEPVANV